MQKALEAGVDQIPASDLKPETSKEADLPSNQNTRQPNMQSSKQADEPMEIYLSSLHPQFGQSDQPEYGSDPNSSHNLFDQSNSHKGCVWLSPKITRTRESVRLWQNTSLSHFCQRKQIPLFHSKSLLSPREQDQEETHPDPIFTGR